MHCDWIIRRPTKLDQRVIRLGGEKVCYLDVRQYKVYKRTILSMLACRVSVD